ncbi:DUF1439 domain-containing protein [Caviibacter abscessus]|uniref:DUF1439 domain-containing protein n=1 Tax=Caviibacter abscessus TaxID=1766719 RepID=UPI0008321941|nr:DUF1439 domain-containing protein [Caviibacter abscessus]
MFKRFILSLLFILSVVSYSSSLQIPTNLLNTGISFIMPIEKNYALKGKLVIQNPNIEIKDNQLYLTVDYENQVIGKHATGKMILKSNLNYDKNSTNLYLKDLSIESFSANNSNFNPESNFFSRMVLKGIYKKIESKPIFILSEYALTKLISVKDIKIINDKIMVIF